MAAVGRFLNAAVVCDLSWASCVSLPEFTQCNRHGEMEEPTVGADRPGIPLLGGECRRHPQGCGVRVSGAKPSASLLPPPPSPGGEGGGVRAAPAAAPLRSPRSGPPHPFKQPRGRPGAAAERSGGRGAPRPEAG